MRQQIPHLVYDTLSHIASSGKIPKMEGKTQTIDGLQRYFSKYHGQEFQECAQESLIAFCDYHPELGRSRLNGRSTNQGSLPNDPG